MADFVTLDALFGSDPAAADNSPADASPTGATSAQAASPPASPDYSSRIADLEGLVQRHRQQLTGSQQEIDRLRTELQEVRNRPAQQVQVPVQAATAPQRRVSLVEANEKFLLDNDKTLLQEYERQQQEATQASKSSLTLDDVRSLLAETEQKRDTRSKAEKTRSGLEQALLTRHPELSNPTAKENTAFINALGETYQELASDPATQFKYAEDPNAMFIDPGTKITYDMRLLLDAGALVQAKQPARAPTPTLPGGGALPSHQSKGPALPRYLVEGPNAALADPEMQKALAGFGWGSTVKEQATHILKHASGVAKQRWQKGEVF